MNDQGYKFVVIDLIRQRGTGRRMFLIARGKTPEGAEQKLREMREKHSAPRRRLELVG